MVVVGPPRPTVTTLAAAAAQDPDNPGLKTADADAAAAPPRQAAWPRAGRRGAASRPQRGRADRGRGRGWRGHRTAHTGRPRRTHGRGRGVGREASGAGTLQWRAASVSHGWRAWERRGREGGHWAGRCW